MDNLRNFFSNEYLITGKHGKYVKLLTSALVGNDKFRKQIKVFETNVSIFANAAIVGFLYNRKADKNKDNNIEPAKIAGTQMMQNRDDVEYNMKLILLLDDEYEPNFEHRLNRAFRYFGEDMNDIALFEQYLRGGIEVLYEKIIDDTADPFLIAGNLVEFVEDFQNTFNKKINKNDIIKLCNEFEGKQN